MRIRPHFAALLRLRLGDDRCKRAGTIRLRCALYAEIKIYKPSGAKLFSRLFNHAHQEICDGARSTYNAYFATVIKFLRGTTTPNDVAWRTAFRLLCFPEIKWTCLGYGAGSVSGTRAVLHTDSDIPNGLFLAATHSA